MSRFRINDAVSTLADIDNLDSVYHLIVDLREQARKQSQPQS